MPWERNQVGNLPIVLLGSNDEQLREREKWLRLFGQNLSIHKWCLADAYAAVGRAGWLSEYTRSGVRPSSARCGLS